MNVLHQIQKKDSIISNGLLLLLIYLGLCVHFMSLGLYHFGVDGLGGQLPHLNQGTLVLITFFCVGVNVLFDLKNHIYFGSVMKLISGMGLCFIADLIPVFIVIVFYFLITFFTLYEVLYVRGRVAKEITVSRGNS